MRDDHWVPGNPHTSERSRIAFNQKVDELTLDEIVTRLQDIGKNGTPAMYAIPECAAAAELLRAMK